MKITAGNINYADLNKQIKESPDKDIDIENVIGQRYIGCGLKEKNINIHGTPGNALGAYMNGATLNIYGNAQDASGDTMNSGKIIIHGNCGDTTGYGMRGGEIFIKGNAGYRIGIHMKEYRANKPVIVVGGETGDFLGEYQAGGIIIVLGVYGNKHAPVGKHCGTGMHGGVMYIRSNETPRDLPKQVKASNVSIDDMKVVSSYVKDFCDFFGMDEKEILNSNFIKLTANTRNPYKQLYTTN